MLVWRIRCFSCYSEYITWITKELDSASKYQIPRPTWSRSSVRRALGYYSSKVYFSGINFFFPRSLQNQQLWDKQSFSKQKTNRANTNLKWYGFVIGRKKKRRSDLRLGWIPMTPCIASWRLVASSNTEVVDLSEPIQIQPFPTMSSSFNCWKTTSASFRTMNTKPTRQPARFNWNRIQHVPWVKLLVALLEQNS